ncbi:MAG TPA: hypothetical protein VHI98_02145 [Vicinamibacterales bacterium]|jgi:hypothetical protein|nr:hypothetical protein [Vicinamibacterales bacterium]
MIDLIAELVEGVNRADDQSAAREAYRHGFERLCPQLQMYPAPSGRPSIVFKSAATTARLLGANCLPLGIAVAMHLYPLCALQCVPLPLMSVARFQRAILLRTIRNRSLILANAGSERTRQADHSVVARHNADGVRLDGTFEYMSLATVADLVLFKAPLADSSDTVLCAADLRADSVRIGPWRFTGTMRLSDTSAVTFVGHRVPRGRYVIVSNDDALHCTSDYQRCWFHLFLAEVYLARLHRLHEVWGLRRTAEQVVSLNEVSQLREYALRLLDEFSLGSDVEPLKKATSTMKLRVSLMAQATMAALSGSSLSGSDASELGYIKAQPTADEVILRSIGAA